jgi:hypothetical protein
VKGYEVNGQQTDQAAPQQSAGPPAGTPAIVDVFARTTTGGSVEFSHEWRWNDGTPGGNGEIGVPARKQNDPGTPIHFHLRDQTQPNRGLDFTDDDLGPIWVLRDSCPPDDQRCEDPEIPADKIDRTPNLLKVVDLNSEECTLHYRLRFKDKDGRAEAYDPAIRNGGTT